MHIDMSTLLIMHYTSHAQYFTCLPICFFPPTGTGEYAPPPPRGQSLALTNFIGESSLIEDEDIYFILALFLFIESCGELWVCLMPPHSRGMLDRLYVQFQLSDSFFKLSLNLMIFQLDLLYLCLKFRLFLMHANDRPQRLV